LAETTDLYVEHLSRRHGNLRPHLAAEAVIPADAGTDCGSRPSGRTDRNHLDCSDTVGHGERLLVAG
jgi:hypothetical protein